MTPHHTWLGPMPVCHLLEGHSGECYTKRELHALMDRDEALELYLPTRDALAQILEQLARARIVTTALPELEEALSRARSLLVRPPP